MHTYSLFLILCVSDAFHKYFISCCRFFFLILFLHFILKRLNIVDIFAVLLIQRVYCVIYNTYMYQMYDMFVYQKGYPFGFTIHQTMVMARPHDDFQDERKINP